MQDKTYENIRGKFMAKWRVEPFSAAQQAVAMVSEIHPGLAGRLYLSGGDHALSGTDLTSTEAALIEEAFENCNPNVVYTCNAYADSEKSAAPAVSMPSYAKRNSMINSNDVVITPVAFEKLETALEANTQKIGGSKPHQFNNDIIKRLGLQAVAFRQNEVSDTNSLQERRFISSPTLNKNRVTIQDSTKVIIAITSPTGSVFPIEEATAFRSPEENRIVVTGESCDFNQAPGDAPEYRAEIKKLVFERKDVKLVVRPFDQACQAIKELDPEEKFHGASKLRGEIDIWGELTEQTNTLIETLRAKGIKIMNAKGCPGFKPDSIDDVDHNMLSAWKTND